MMCEELGFPNFSKGEPINNLNERDKKTSEKTNTLDKKTK